MKIRTVLFHILLSTFVGLATAGAQPCSGQAKATAACGTGPCLVADQLMKPLVLNEPARAALRFQLEEERMARELYVTFGEQWGVRQFSNIARAERRHESALRALATRAGMALPPVIAGRFESILVQQRFDTLLAQGRQSALEALKVGVAVEEQDIADLVLLAASTDSAELCSLVTAQEQASQRHLRAFQSGARQGATSSGS